MVGLFIDLGLRILAYTLLFVFKEIHLTYKLSVSRNGRWPLVEGYDLVEYGDPKGRPFWELTTSPDNSQFQKMMSDPKRKFAARKMIDQISKIYDYGLKVASGTSKL